MLIMPMVVKTFVILNSGCLILAIFAYVLLDIATTSAKTCALTLTNVAPIPTTVHQTLIVPTLKAHSHAPVRKVTNNWLDQLIQSSASQARTLCSILIICTIKDQSRMEKQSRKLQLQVVSPTTKTTSTMCLLALMVMLVLTLNHHTNTLDKFSAPM